MKKYVTWVGPPWHSLSGLTWHYKPRNCTHPVNNIKNLTLSGQVLKLHSAFNLDVKDEHIILVNMSQGLKNSSVKHFLFFILTDFWKKNYCTCATWSTSITLYCTLLYLSFILFDNVHMGHIDTISTYTIIHMNHHTCH